MTVVKTDGSRSSARPRLGRTAGLALLFIVELAILGLAIPDYLSVDGLLDATRSFSEAGIVAFGMMFVIVTGGIDLSVGSLLALCSVATGFSYQAGLPAPLAIALGFLVGIAGGAVNGLMIVTLGLHPLLVTLGTFALFRGVAYAISSANAVSSFPSWFGVFGQYEIGGIVPIQFVVLVCVAVAAWVVLERTAFGRYVTGTGSNEQALRFIGIRTARVKIAAYTLTGGLVALASLIFTSRISSARGNAGLGLELTTIAMVVLGGTQITGGVGTAIGTAVGVVIISYLQDALSFAGVQSDWGLVVTGTVLVAGVLANEVFRSEVR